MQQASDLNRKCTRQLDARLRLTIGIVDSEMVVQFTCAARRVSDLSAQTFTGTAGCPDAFPVFIEYRMDVGRSIGPSAFLHDLLNEDRGIGFAWSSQKSVSSIGAAFAASLPFCRPSRFADPHRFAKVLSESIGFGMDITPRRQTVIVYARGTDDIPPLPERLHVHADEVCLGNEFWTDRRFIHRPDIRRRDWRLVSTVRNDPLHLTDVGKQIIQG